MKTTILMDITQLPAEYKSMTTLKDRLEQYEKDYNVKIVPYDTSKSNIQGNANFMPQIIKIAE